MVNQKGMQEKVSIMDVWCGLKNLSLGITVRHHSASLVMPISDPRDRFFYHTPMKDTYILIKAEIESPYQPVTGSPLLANSTISSFDTFYC